MRRMLILILLSFVVLAASGQADDGFDILAWGQVQFFGVNEDTGQFVTYYESLYSGDRAIVVRKRFLGGPMLLMVVLVRRVDGSCFIGRLKVVGKYSTLSLQIDEDA